MESGRFQQSFALFDAEGRLVDWDDGYMLEWELTGITPGAGNTYAELLKLALNEPAIRRFLSANRKDDTPEAFVSEQIKGFGTNRTQEYITRTGRRIRIDEKRTVTGGVRRLASDITDEKDAEDALVAQQRLEQADTGTGGVAIETRRNPDGSYAFPPISDGLRRLLDLPDEFTGKDPMMIYSRMIRTPEDDVRHAAMLEQSARTMELFTMEYRIRDGQDRIRWIRRSMVPRREADGTVVFSGVMRDVTREKDAEDRLEMLRSVVVRSSDAIVIFENSVGPDGESRIIYVNDRFTQMFGWTAEELIRAPIDYEAWGGLNSPAAGMIAAALQYDDSPPVEFEVAGKDGTYRWIEARVATIQKFENGNFRWVIMSRDVGERRQAQEDLLRAKDAAEAGNRAKGQFLANMSHELRTPLNAIIGFTELIENGVAKTGWTQTYDEYLTHVRESGQHLLALINTILDLSKIEAGSLKLNAAPIDPHELVQSSLALISSLARTGDIALVTIIPDECPKISGDFLKLKQVLLNILSNAIKFTPAGGRITTQVGVLPDCVEITIKDTGCGISAADLQRVMQPFVQVETALSRKFAGSGLGLSIARELCGLHGGRLEINSTQGEGTTVRIVLPR